MIRGALLKTVVVAIVVVTIPAAGLLLCPPFLLPDFLYDVAYGWRYPKETAAGDTILVDMGPAAASIRYQIDIAIPSGAEPSGTVNLGGLPKVRFFVGALLPTSGQASGWADDWQRLRRTRFSISVADRAGNVVASHAGFMGGDWIWSGPYGQGAFLYALDTGFNPSPRMEYVLDYEFKGAGELPNGTIIRIEGGGWK